MFIIEVAGLKLSLARPLTPCCREHRYQDAYGPGSQKPLSLEYTQTMDYNPIREGVPMSDFADSRSDLYMMGHTEQSVI